MVVKSVICEAADSRFSSPPRVSHVLSSTRSSTPPKRVSLTHSPERCALRPKEAQSTPLLVTPGTEEDCVSISKWTRRKRGLRGLEFGATKTLAINEYVVNDGVVPISIDSMKKPTSRCAHSSAVLRMASKATSYCNRVLAFVTRKRNWSRRQNHTWQTLLSMGKQKALNPKDATPHGLLSGHLLSKRNETRPIDSLNLPHFTSSIGETGREMDGPPAQSQDGRHSPCVSQMGEINKRDQRRVTFASPLVSFSNPPDWYLEFLANLEGSDSEWLETSNQKDLRRRAKELLLERSLLAQREVNLREICASLREEFLSLETDLLGRKQLVADWKLRHDEAKREWIEIHAKRARM